MITEVCISCYNLGRQETTIAMSVGLVEKSSTYGNSRSLNKICLEMYILPWEERHL